MPAFEIYSALTVNEASPPNSISTENNSKFGHDYVMTVVDTALTRDNTRLECRDGGESGHTEALEAVERMPLVPFRKNMRKCETF